MKRQRKYTDAQVREIRAWHAAKNALPTAAAIRRKYKISPQMLSFICQRLIYKRVK